MMLNAALAVVLTIVMILYFATGLINFMGKMWVDEIGDKLSTDIENFIYRNKLKDEIHFSNYESLIRIANKYNFNIEENLDGSFEIEYDELEEVEDDDYFYNDVFIMEIYLFDNLIYTNVEGISLKNSFLEEGKLSDIDMNNPKKQGRLFLTNEFLVEKDILSFDDIVLGQLYMSLNPYMFLVLAILFIPLLLGIALIVIALSSVISHFVAKKLIAPLHVLNERLDILSEDNIEHVIPIEYKEKKPLIELVALVDSTNKIINKIRSYAQLLHDQKEELAVQNDELIDNGIRLEELNSALKNTNIHLKDILDNVGQGFLKLTGDLRVHPGYSRECDVIFGEVIHNKSFADLISPSDEKQAKFIESLMGSILTESKSKVDLYIPLLPEEFILNSKVISLDYSISIQNNQRSIIVVLTDITGTRSLENQMEKERHVLQMIVNYLLYHGQFTELLREFEDFLVESNSKDGAVISSMEEEIHYLLHQLHTFKGNFAQFNAIDMAEAIHKVETQVIERMNNGKVGFEFQYLNNAYSELLDLIERHVGKEFVNNEDYIVVDKSYVKEVIQFLSMNLSDKNDQYLISKLESLLYVSIKDMLSSYKMYIQKLADKLEKSVSPLIIEGDDVYLDEKKYLPLIKSLVHIFNNAVIHGIETPDERLDSGKEITGQIECILSADEESFIISIKDDGKGIEEEYKSHIFEDQYSTSDNITIHSGRGVGLSALINEVNKLAGSIEVVSQVGLGSEFKIHIPQIASSEEKKASVDVIKGIVDSMINYFSVLTGDKIEKVEYNIEKVKKVELYTMSSLTRITGGIDAYVLITIDKNFEDDIVMQMKESGILNDYKTDINREVLKEVSNTILGNVLGEYSVAGDVLDLGIPLVVHHDCLSLYLEKNEVVKVDLGNESRSCSIYMLDMRKFKI
jgi:two-component system chemotaxis sensor kinase CheA